MTATAWAGLLLAVAALLWPPPRGVRQAAALAGGDRSARRTASRAGDAEQRGVSSWLRVRRAGARRRTDRSTLQLLDRLAAGLRAGLPPGVAWEAAARAGCAPGLLEEVLTATGEGRSPAAALARAARQRHDPHLARAARAWTLSERTGAPLAEAVEGAARSGRAQLDHERAVSGATAGARATVTLLSLLPVAGAGAALLFGIPPSRLYGSAAAVAAAACGLVLTVLGRAVVARMIRRVEAA